MSELAKCDYPRCGMALERCGACDKAPLSATQRSEPDAAALRYLLDSTAPDGQWADQAVHNFVGAMLKQSPPPATARSEPTEWQVEVAAGEIAASPLIDAPKLPFPAWMGLARSILNAVFAAAPLSEKQAIPDGWKLVCEKCGSDSDGPCGWPSNCPTKRHSGNEESK